MIAFLRGTLARNLGSRLWIDVQGVGYMVHVAPGRFDTALEGEPIRVLTHLAVREDAMTLYGFASEEEQEIFSLLIDHVTGVGPRMALAVIGGSTVRDFKDAVVRSDITALSKIRGVGRKTAERIVLELKDKVGLTAIWSGTPAAPTPGDKAFEDAVLALLALGFKQVEAVKATRAAVAAAPSDSLTADALIRAALRELA